MVIGLAILGCTYTIPKEREKTQAERKTEFRDRMKRLPKEQKVKFLLGTWRVFVSEWNNPSGGREEGVTHRNLDTIQVLTIDNGGSWRLTYGGETVVGEWRLEEPFSTADFTLTLTRTPKIPGFDAWIAFQGHFGESGVLLTTRISVGQQESGVDWELQRKGM
jgi:hypothetical protein